MSRNKIIVLVLAMMMSVFVLIGVIMNFSIENTEIDLRNRVVAQQEKCEAYFDKMWKIISQEADVAEKYKDSFKEIYPELIEGRYSQGDGTFMKWIQESNPAFDVSLYSKLMNSIEIERTGFFNEQSALIDMQREHNSYLLKAPNRWFLNDTLKAIDIQIITSSQTKETYQTGEENDIKLFE
jgi:hypothetical protein